MDLAALSDSDDDEELRARLRATADRDASALAGAANAGPIPQAPAVPSDDAPSPKVDESAMETERAEPASVVIYRDVCEVLPVTLRFPFEFDGAEIASVSLLPPTFGDVEAVTTGRMSELEMHARMGGLPVAALRAMRWPDIEVVTLMARHLAPDIQRR